MLPAAEMDFVDRDGLAERIGLRAAFHPLVVVPFVRVEIGNNGCRARGHFGRKPVRVGLVYGMSVAEDAILVAIAVFERGNEQFPNAAGNVFAHLVCAAIPAIEIADHAHTRCVRSPNGEIHPLDAFDGPLMRAQTFVRFPMAAFAEEIQIVIGHHGRKRIGVVHRDQLSLVILNPQLVVARLR